MPAPWSMWWRKYAYSLNGSGPMNTTRFPTKWPARKRTRTIPVRATMSFFPMEEDQ